MEQLKFYDKDHEEFYKRIIAENNLQNDCYRKSLFYLIGLTEETRKNYKRIYNFKENGIETNVLNEAWQTGTTLKITRLAFNLYNGYTGRNIEEENEKDYTVEEIFCNRKEYAPYFYIAIQIRFEMIK